MLQRPAFAAAMMNVLTLSSEIEYRWAVVLAEILEAEAGGDYGEDGVHDFSS